MASSKFCKSLVYLYIFTYILQLGSLLAESKEAEESEELLVFTVATAETDGFKRFIRSTKKYGLSVKTLGLGEEWKGGDMEMGTGGGHKIILLKEAMEQYKDREDLIVMFTDSYDLVFTSGEKDILAAFEKMNSKVVFSAEGFCWPDRDLMDDYPLVKMTEKRYLNSGGFMGYAPQIYSILTSSAVGFEDDDQLFYTKIFLNKDLRKQLSIKLDTKNEIFQNLHGALDEVKLKFKGGSSFLYNTYSGSTPMVVHGNGPIKPEFNALNNYLVDHWTPINGCQGCKEDTISINGLKEEDHPKVLLSIFIERPTPFIKEFFEKVAALKYPKSRIDIFLHYADTYHTEDVNKFLLEHQNDYASVTQYTPESKINQWKAKNMAIDECININCQYFFMLDSEAHLDNANVLTTLIEQNRSVIAPLIMRPGKLWSNFWGAIGRDGFYKRSDDYMEIIEYRKKGIWNVPYMANVILVHGHRLEELRGAFLNGDLDPDMAFCKTLRDKGVFMYVMNKADDYGHLINSDNVDPTHVHEEMYQMFDNRQDWERKYIHPDYYKHLNELELTQPCPDVYWYPVVTPEYCEHLIEIMETHDGGKGWSGGKNEDARLAGGYENVPTVDIHMNQVGLEPHWLTFLKDYIAPVSLKAFPGFYTRSNAIMNFVVRYKPDEQPLLRPHHDSSTFTINLALNRVGVDYEGGGCRFLRYNCSITSPHRGWALMHPGRLTHYHEGLRTTSGVRYIMVSFVDP
ncbi:unnamed protein product [Owenia fusiformis]|uniref:procollagen-lysine 5-dioxygenase n=1 Tax=Owenia fusiformis TaxID=6347 RepID=A0A8J1TT23_OWEFU|nr:unnamed protein product [Owenia fusiformis]